MNGTLHRNFQGFTDDAAANLIGLGSSAISSFPDLLAQNEKNSGRYRMLAGQGLLTTERGILRSADDRYRGAVIERLLCDGSARIGSCLAREIAPGLAPFVEQGLVTLDGSEICLKAAGLPYVRAIAATFDRYRQPKARIFSSAI